MSATDGYIVGTTKVVDHGPDNLRWNLVIIGDGYREGELTQYHTDVQNFVTALRNTPPFDELFCGINVHRIDVVSNDSGADDPGCAGGAATTANTYFDATFCTVWAGTPMDRLLSINDALAISVSSMYVPLRHQVLCIVNSSKYGGSGGTIATCSTAAASSSIAIHEIGHSAFGLADEYGGDGTGTPAGEPPEPNVTRNTNRATNKWRALIAAATPMPSQCDGSCGASTCVAPGAPPPAGAVGTYEGGSYSDCNTYRPLPSCYMRNYQPFCPVCSGVIRQTLQPFLPAESINLITPSITFLNVPAGIGGIGVTTHRAIVWEVVSCRRLRFQITAGPTGGFGTPAGTLVSVSSDPILPVASARIWVSYTSTNPGDSANGTVTVRCVETGQIWIINIIANTIARPRSAVTLVLDRSGSMNDDAGDGITKIQKLREAANSFVSVMQPGDGIGIVRFNASAQRLMEIEDVGTAPGGSGRITAIGILNGTAINPSGATSIGDGVVNGKQMLDDAQVSTVPPYDVSAMVVLTDGQWNTPPSLATVSGSITSNTYAIGFGLPSNISVPALVTLCQGHNGYLLITGAITADQTMRLNKYFIQILAGITNAQIVADPRGVLDITSEHRIPFWICEADYGMDLIILSPVPQVIDFQLETPDGTRITPGFGGANSQFVISHNTSYYRCALPVIPANDGGSHSGLWHAILKLGHQSSEPLKYNRLKEFNPSYYDPKRAVLPYEFVAHAYSSLTFVSSLRQNSFEIGGVVHLVASILEYDVPLLKHARVWAEIQLPGGLTEYVSFSRDSNQKFVANYELQLPGVFTFRIRARGATMHGSPFEREQTHTAVAVPGGDKWDPNDPKTDDCCEWLQCLSEEGVITDQLVERLKKLGVDLPSLLRCLGERCKSKLDEIEVRQPHKRYIPNTKQLSNESIEHIIELVVNRIKGRLS
ncbi:MAG TPA: M64 family metallopeptidase [Saprospiraceae bacterium]|nr:M64 family metallopeptidase [Saprospiraceae bacterium]